VCPTSPIYWAGFVFECSGNAMLWEVAGIF
jgi:hypothetical protein